MIDLTTILIAAACFLIGAGVGHLYSRKLGGNGKSVADLEKALASSEEKLKNYQHAVTEHFVKVSHLTTNMAQSYREIHEHLASSAIRLANPEVGRQLLKASGGNLMLSDADGNPLVSSEELHPPRDYAPKVPGGVLSEDYGLKDPEGAANAMASADEDGEEQQDPTHSIA